MIRDITNLKKFDAIFYYKKGSADIVGDIIEIGETAPKDSTEPVHIAAYAGDYLYQICLKFIKSPSFEQYRHILDCANGLLPKGFTVDDVKRLIDSRYSDLQHCKFEAHMDTGVAIRLFDLATMPIVDVGRYVDQLDDYHTALLTRKFEAKLGAEYDLASFPSVYIRSTIGQLLKCAGLSDGRPILHDFSKYICSTYFAVCFDESGIRLDHMNPWNMSPSDIKFCNNIKLVSV